MTDTEKYIELLLKKFIDLLYEPLMDVYKKLVEEGSEKTEEEKETSEAPKERRRFERNRTRKELLRMFEKYDLKKGGLCVSGANYKPLAAIIGCAEKTVENNLRRMEKAGEIIRIYKEDNDEVYKVYKITKKGRSEIR